MQIGGLGRFALALSFALTACNARHAPAPTAHVVVAAQSLPAPAPADIGSDCADVGRVRACWSDAKRSNCAHGVCLVPRPLPDAPHLGRWRCSGVGRARVCQDSSLDASSFECHGALCVQKTPHLPDDGQWECAAFDGAVLCHFIAPAAGVVAGPPDPAFTCGARRGHPGERVCLDLSPDMPGPGGWHCYFRHLGGVVERRCEKGGHTPLGGSCGAGCKQGSSCVGGHCLPLSPHPDCWFDKDCGAGARCELGSCRRAM